MTNEPKAETHNIPKDQAAPHEQFRHEVVVRGRGYGRTVEQEPPDCGECYACLNDAGACHNPPRPVGIQAVPTLVNPPKYGPPPGYSAEKWRSMSRASRRAALRDMARTINKVVK